MNNRPTSPVLRALDGLLEGRTGSWVINLVVIPALVFLVIVLPPLALPQRILSAGYTGIAPGSGGGVSVPDGTRFSIPPGVTKSGVSVRLTTLPIENFLKNSLAQDLPPVLEVKSPLYQLSLQGQMPPLAVLSIPIPEGADPFATLDVYGLVGKKWTKIPFQLYPDDQFIEAYLTTAIPRGVIVVQTTAQSPTISADLSGRSALPTSAAALLAEVNPVGLTLADSGGISGSVPSTPETSASSPYQVLPTVSNLEGDQVLGALVDDMITSPEIRKQHVQTLVDLAVEKLYPGVSIDYQDVSPDNQNDFTAFVRELAQALHEKDKLLGVTLSLPEQKSLDTWDTGAFDWMAIGQAADIVKIPLPPTREGYSGDSPPGQAYLQWAVGRVDRSKLQLTFSMLGRDEFGSAYAPIGFANAFKLIGAVDAPKTLVPDAKALFDLPGLRDGGGIKIDAPSGLYSFSYKDDKSQTHTVWVESADSLAKKIALATQYNVRGVALRDLNAEALDTRVWDALKQYQATQTPTVKGKLTLVWRVNGQVVGKSPPNDPRFTWTAPAQPGEAKVEAVLSFDDGQTAVGSTGTTTMQIARAVVVRPTPEAAPQPTRAPAAPPSAFRGQNLFNYGAQLNWTNSDNGAEMGQLIQMGFKWAKVQIRWCDFEGNKGNIDFSQMDRVVAAANSRGIKLLFSVVCAPTWSRADRGAGGSGPPDNMQDAADFMGNVAGKYCGGALGAIEVWNEHNLLTEWHGKPISAAMYMDMLKKSYATIRARCQGMIVVAGAPTPTGVMSAEAIDDVAFLHQLYQNGLKDYSDAIGAHPSGFCNAPDAGVGASNPCGGQYNNHRSFFFRETMQSYRAVMVQYGDRDKQIWPTEFGWGVDPSPKPGYDYERNISLDLQAKWLVQAYQWAKQQGYVGVMILWNLDFADMGNETGAFHVVGRPAFDALAGMPK